MMKLLFSIFFLMSSFNSIFAEKIEFEDENKNNIFEFKMTGNRTELISEKTTLNCSNKAGNKTYLNSKGEIIFRSSVKADHISIYSYPDSKILCRISIKAERYKVTYAEKSIQLRVNNSKGKLSDENGQAIAEAHFNASSNNIKCKTTSEKISLLYKSPKANFAGLLWFAPNIPDPIKIILIHELIIKN